MTSLIEVELLIRDDGALCGAYLKLRDGKAVRTEVVKRDVLLADYDRQGRLVGIDVLAPTDVSVVIGLVEDPNQRKAITRLMRNRLGDLLKVA